MKFTIKTDEASVLTMSLRDSIPHEIIAIIVGKTFHTDAPQTEYPVSVGFRGTPSTWNIGSDCVTLETEA